MLAGWIISLTTILLIVYANDPQATDQTKEEFLAYQTLFRTSWSIALSWIIFATAKVLFKELFLLFVRLISKAVMCTINLKSKCMNLYFN